MVSEIHFPKRDYCVGKLSHIHIEGLICTTVDTNSMSCCWGGRRKVVSQASRKFINNITFHLSNYFMAGLRD